MTYSRTPTRCISFQGRLKIDRAIGQTPCLCGSMVTWHQECFAGKSDGQVKTAYDRAYLKVSKILKKRREIATKDAIAKARKK